MLMDKSDFEVPVQGELAKDKSPYSWKFTETNLKKIDQTAATGMAMDLVGAQVNSTSNTTSNSTAQTKSSGDNKYWVHKGMEFFI